MCLIFYYEDKKSIKKILILNIKTKSFETTIKVNNVSKLLKSC